MHYSVWTERSIVSTPANGWSVCQHSGLYAAAVTCFSSFPVAAIALAPHHPFTAPFLHRFGQTELNKLDVVVSLKLNQLYCMDNAVEGHTGDGGEDGEKPRFAAFMPCHVCLVSAVSF